MVCGAGERLGASGRRRLLSPAVTAADSACPEPVDDDVTPAPHRRPQLGSGAWEDTERHRPQAGMSSREVIAFGAGLEVLVGREGERVGERNVEAGYCLVDEY